jgi:hypothetical protein
MYLKETWRKDVDYTHSVKDMDKCQDLVNRVTKLWLGRGGGDFLSSSRTSNFLNTSVPHTGSTAKWQCYRNKHIVSYWGYQLFKFRPPSAI